MLVDDQGRGEKERSSNGRFLVTILLQRAMVVFLYCTSPRNDGDATDGGKVTSASLVSAVSGLAATVAGGGG